MGGKFWLVSAFFKVQIKENKGEFGSGFRKETDYGEGSLFFTRR